MQEIVYALGFAVMGYFCGSIPFALLAGRFKGVDLRTQGSGNIGATNAGRVLGRPWGFLVFGLDALKGFLPVFGYVRWRGELSANGEVWMSCLFLAVVACACILGHLFPIYLKFKGGKGVATSLGVVMAIPYFVPAALAAFGVWAVFVLTTRYISLASMSAAVAFPIIFAGVAVVRRETWGTTGDLWPLHGITLAICFLVVYRHRSNIRRLLAGTESRVNIFTRSD